MKLIEKIFLGFFIMLASLHFTTVGLADDWIKPGEERWFFSGGVFLPNFDTNLRVDNRTLGAGTKIDIENDLGFTSDETTFWLGAYWRFAARHRISISYTQFNREATATAKTDLTIGDEIFPAGASLNSEFKFKILPVNYAYSFMKREKFELAASIGLHWNRVDFDVKGSASLGDQDSDANVSADADVPLPLLGLRLDYHFTPRWTAGLHGEIFALNIDADTFGFSGSLINLKLSTEYWLFNNFAVGAAISYFNLDVDVDDGDWKGKLDYQYWGPQVYAAIRF